MSAGTFPLLSNREILLCMSELGCNMTEEQLTKPGFEQVIRAMEQMLDLFMGFTVEDHAQMKFSGTDAFDYPEIHEYSVGQLALTRSLLKDIYEPEAPRLRMILSAIINFAKFREEKVAAFEEYVQKTEALQLEKQLVDREFETLTEQLHQARQQHEMEQPLIADVTRDNQRMEDEIRRLNTEQATIKSKIHDLKQQRQQLSDKRDRDQFSLLSMRAEVSKMQSQVVRSPERVKREISETSQTLEGDREQLKEMDDRLKSLQTKVDGLSKTERDVSKLMKQLREVEDALGKHKTARRDTKRLRARMAELEAAFKELQAQEQSLQRQKDSAESRANDMESRQKLKVESAEREKAVWRQRKATVEKENANLQQQALKLEEEAKALEKTICDIAATDAAEAIQIKEESAKVEAEVRAYNRRVLAAIAAD